MKSSNDDKVRQRQSMSKFPFEDIPSAGIASRLEDRPQPSPRIRLSNSTQGFLDGCGMMGEIIHHQHAANLTFDLLPPLDPGKSGQTVTQSFPVDPQLPTHAVNREGVLHVVASDNRDLDQSIRPTSVKWLEEAFPLTHFDVFCRPICWVFAAVINQPAAGRGDDLLHCRIILARKQTAARWNELHQTSKRIL